MPSANDIAVTAIIVSGSVAVISPVITTIVAWRDRLQKTSEGKATRLWTAKSAALTKAAELATQLQVLPKNELDGTFWDLYELGNVIDASNEVAAPIYTIAHTDVSTAYRQLLHTIQHILPSQNDRWAIAEARKDLSRLEDQSSFEDGPEVYEAALVEKRALDRSGIREAWTQGNITRIHDKITKLLDEIAKDAQRG